LPMNLRDYCDRGWRDLPQTQEGAIVGIADKIDTIVGFFGVGLPPTSTADPYALRRQSLGIINIHSGQPLSSDTRLAIDEHCFI